MRHDIFPTPVWHIEGAPLELVDELYEKGLELKQFHKAVSYTHLTLPTKA
mgnify:CR=1 FL=1